MRTFSASCLLTLAALAHPGASHAQAPQVRPTPAQYQRSAELGFTFRAKQSVANGSNQPRIGNVGKGALIGGGVGLGLSGLFLLAMHDSSDSGGWSTIDLLGIAVATGLGAIIGAAIGAGAN